MLTPEQKAALAADKKAIADAKAKEKAELKAIADAEKAEKAKAAAELKAIADAEKAEKAKVAAELKAIADAEAAKAKKEVKYKVNFGVNIPEMNRVFSKEDLEADADACAYLVEIGSPSVTKL